MTHQTLRTSAMWTSASWPSSTASSSVSATFHAEQPAKSFTAYVLLQAGSWLMSTVRCSPPNLPHQ